MHMKQQGWPKPPCPCRSAESYCDRSSTSSSCRQNALPEDVSPWT
ncbi:unnamed protein product [Arabidopsis halleri]